MDKNLELALAEQKKGRVRRMKALMMKEFYQIFRDPSSLLTAFLLPILLVFLYGTGVSLDLDHLKVGLVLEDTSPIAQNFTASLQNSRYFDVTIVRDRRELHDELTKGKIRGYFVLPSYFTQFLAREDKVAPIQLIADGSEANTANFVKNYGEGVLQNWKTQEAVSNGFFIDKPYIKIQPRYWFNEELESRFFLLPGSLAIIMTFTGALLTALVVAREWERGTMESLMSTTISIRELILAKILPYFTLGMISMFLCVFVSVFVYDVPLRGSILLLSFVSAVFLFTSLGLGLMISTLTKNQVFAYQITLIVGFLPAYILSGFLFEIHSMPAWIKCITYFIPARYFVQSLQTLFLVGNVYKLIFLNLIPIACFGFLFFAITAFKTVKRLD